MSPDDPETLKWIRRGAEQGNAFAQFNLGVTYAKARDDAKDLVEAHKWLDLAAAGGYDEAPELLNVLAKKMGPSDVAKAQRMAREWMATKNKERKAK